MDNCLESPQVELNGRMSQLLSMRSAKVMSLKLEKEKGIFVNFIFVFAFSCAFQPALVSAFDCLRVESAPAAHFLIH